MSDDAYSSFLDQANQSTTKPSTQSASKPKTAQLKAIDKDQKPPSSLGSIDATYASESDESFEPVALGWSGGDSIDAESFASAIGHSGEAEEMSAKDFDPKGDYKDVIELVKKEGKGSPKVFRVGAGGARCYYYVVTIDGKGRLVGVRVLAVES